MHLRSSRFWFKTQPPISHGFTFITISALRVLGKADPKKWVIFWSRVLSSILSSKNEIGTLRLCSSWLPLSSMLRSKPDYVKPEASFS